MITLHLEPQPLTLLFVKKTQRVTYTLKNSHMWQVFVLPFKHYCLYLMFDLLFLTSRLVVTVRLTRFKMNIKKIFVVNRARVYLFL